MIREANSSPYTYVSSSTEIEYDVLDALHPVTVQFDFRDMKYLSMKTPFSVEINTNEPEVGSGNTWAVTTGSVPIDFSSLQKKDASGQSRYIVGGRTYFEASVFGTDTNSFTFKGFFDQEGYEEPKSTLNKLKSSGWLWVIISACIVVVILAIVLYCYCKNKKEQERQQKKAKRE